MSPSAAPPSPQEVHRKLSISVARNSKPPPPVTVPTVSGNESDSDSILTPDWNLSPSGMISGASGTILPGSLQQQPLSSIAERRSGSGEDSEDDDDEGEGGWKTAQMGEGHAQGSIDESVIKTGYLWKKGERRKTWKKRWFVLRPAHLAYYKTAAEYQLLRLFELSDVHSCTQVSLKKHENAFGLISPVRTFYLQAKTSAEVQEWVTAIEEARQALHASSAQTSPSAPIPIPRASNHPPTPLPITPSPPSFVSHNATSSDSEDASPSAQSAQRAYSTSSQTRPVIGFSPSKSQPSASSKDPSKVVLTGYLMKCGSKRRNWRKRWFVMSGEKLIYSASHMDTKPHRQFPFSDILDALEYDVVSNRLHYPPSVSSPPNLEGGGSEGPSTAHTFKIITTKRTLLLCAPTEEDEIKWLGAVRALIARRSLSGDTAKAPPSGGASNPDTSLHSSGFTTSGGIKGKVRRLSASGGSGTNREEASSSTGQS
ncbi:pleckstrin-like protein [Lentinula aff. lateritia]|uniref:Pleckstrin-like protein n=1 Tax=Lentinula aff. lateritia TaxID=2804960 RepID=A0ACC1U2N5_9AGAR|nr:pleckstrin-like protein [Lentinula aff. lateritia]